MSSAYGSTRLIEDLHELQEELEVAKIIAEEKRLETEILVETKSLLVLQSQRHAAEFPIACSATHAHAADKFVLHDELLQPAERVHLRWFV
eukprot:COSAG02_NODE_12507_length_1535_cov_1.603064_1_plen_91_part_00